MSLAINSKIDEEARSKIHSALDQVAGLHDMLFHTQQQLLGLQQENADLKRQVAAAQSWEQRAAQYSLVKSSGRALVYRFSGQPEHYACPNCFETSRISILQDRGVAAGLWDCPACSQSFNVTAVRR